MAGLLRRRGPSKFVRAADGSMTLVEHLVELRTRLFRAALAIVVGFVIGYLLSKPAFDLVKKPYCDLFPADQACPFIQLGPTDSFLIRLKIALWLGLVVAAPVWLYQLWAFVAPGLHRHERKWAYLFVGIATPLFAGGAVLAYLVLQKGLYFLLSSGVLGVDQTQLDVTRYVDFVTNLVLIFGVAFEFPLLALMLNVTGVLSGRRMLHWWRAAVFAFFVFSAIMTPTPDPFGMTALALCLTALYFGAVGLALLNDRRKGRGKEIYAGLADDEISRVDGRDEIAAAEPVEAPTPVDERPDVPAPRRYDDTT